ncbi:NAD(P)-binding protein [Trichoderma velutinum]
MASFAETHKSPYTALTSAISGKPLAGRAILITGAGRGVGEHITHEMAIAGAERIGITGRDQPRILAARERFAKAYLGTTFEAFVADITDEEAMHAVFESFGVPDILINNAGTFSDNGPFVEQDLKAWWSGFEINILGTAIVTQQFLRAKPRAKVAVVLNVTSMGAHMRFPLVGFSGYNGSKMGQVRIFESIRFEHPEVRFINIHPGNIQSDGFVKSKSPVPQDGMTDGAVTGQFLVWLASEEADFLSGRFVWAEWDIDELKTKKKEILEQDLLLTTIDGFKNGF